MYINNYDSWQGFGQLNRHHPIIAIFKIKAHSRMNETNRNS